MRKYDRSELAAAAHGMASSSERVHPDEDPASRAARGQAAVQEALAASAARVAEDAAKAAESDATTT